VVGEALRRQGVGTMLIEHVHAWAREREIDYVDLTVFAFNEAAIAFYEMLGYSIVSHRMGRALSDAPVVR